MSRNDEFNTEMRQRSGSVTNRDRLAAFLYDLTRDLVPPGKIEELIRQLPKQGEEVKYTNGWLASYCEDVARRILNTEVSR